jgi:hypothetical protein
MNFIGEYASRWPGQNQKQHRTRGLWQFFRSVLISRTDLTRFSADL